MWGSRTRSYIPNSPSVPYGSELYQHSIGLESRMFHRISRACELLRSGGIKGFVAHLFRYIAYRIETSKVAHFSPNKRQTSEYDFGRIGKLNDIGAVVARTIPSDFNKSIEVPFQKSINTTGFDNVAVIIHIFYPELTAKLMNYLENMPLPFGLFISTDSEAKRDEIVEVISRSSVSPIETIIRIVPNRGRDVAPKYIAFSDVYRRYPAFLHLHSKKSLHAGDAYSSWLDYLLNSLIGSKEIAESNLEILSDAEVGVVYPEHADFIKPVINWGFDYPIARDLLRRSDITLDVFNILEFPSGSMYWGRSTAIIRLLELELAFSDFPDEEGQVDGTLAHAIERSLLLFIEKAGFQWRRVVTTGRSHVARPVEVKGFEPVSTSNQAYISTIQRNFFETLRIMAVPCSSQRLRLNLIIPSLRASDIFGGIDTALKLFRQIIDAAAGDVDFRIIVSDATVPSDVPEIVKNFHLQILGEETVERLTIVDATNRIDKYLEVRRNDVFVATAWWTALNAFRLKDFQATVFGNSPKLIYFIQDFEPGFYGWSTKYALAESTYKRPDETVAVINSEELDRYMHKYYQFRERFLIPYTINATIQKSLVAVPKERILLFYSRPSAVRNCFEAGIDGLLLWARRYPDLAAKWKVYCIGETFPAHRVGELQNVIITGKMSLEKYGDLLSRASVGLSLMISPHPSYPPLEMASAGIRTISNSYEFKNLSERSELITSIDFITPETIADALELNVNAAEHGLGSVSLVAPEIRSLATNTPAFDATKVIELFQVSSA